MWRRAWRLKPQDGRPTATPFGSIVAPLSSEANVSTPLRLQCRSPGFEIRLRLWAWAAICSYFTSVLTPSQSNTSALPSTPGFAALECDNADIAGCRRTRNAGFDRQKPPTSFSLASLPKRGSPIEGCAIGKPRARKTCSGHSQLGVAPTWGVARLSCCNRGDRLPALASRQTRGTRPRGFLNLLLGCLCVVLRLFGACCRALRGCLGTLRG